MSFNLNNSEKYRVCFEDNFLRTIDTYAKKGELTLESFGRGEGVHCKVFLMYNVCLYDLFIMCVCFF